MTTDQFARRRAGIGGSDIAAILGINPYKSPAQVWWDKTGRTEPAPAPEVLERMRFGQILEPIIAQAYTERTGQDLFPGGPLPPLAEHPLILGTADYFASDLSKIIECKNVGHFAAARREDWGEPGTSDVPVPYFLQCQWYMGIAGIHITDLAALVGGNELRIYTIEYDSGLFWDCVHQSELWWARHVITDTPPAPRDEAEARARWPAHSPGRSVEASSSTAEAVRSLAGLKVSMKAMEFEEQRLKDQILTEVGEAEQLESGGQVLATWKANRPSKKTDWESLARSLGASQTNIDLFTKEIPGARVLRLK